MKRLNAFKGLALSFSLLFAAMVALAPTGALAAYYTADEFAGINCSNTITASKVRYSQDSIAANFANGTSVQSLIDALNDGTTTAADVPAIRIVKVDPSQKVKSGGNTIAKGVYTLDNRRLYAFTTAGKPIKCTKLDAIPGSQKFKFTTDNNGTSITVR